MAKNNPSLLLLASLLATAGCTPDPHAPTAASTPPAELRRGNGGDPGSLDPALAEDLHAYNVLGDLYEGLLVATANGDIAPGVAEGWDVSADGLLWRFRLRNDARWTNGERVTAGHFVYGMRHALDPRSRSPNAFLLEPVENASAVLRGELSAESLGITAHGDGALLIQLARPAPWLPTILSMPIASPRMPGVHDDPQSFNTPAKFVGNGPYRLDAWRPGAEIRLVRNQQFHSPRDAAIDVVRYLPLVDPTAEFNLYRTGELDITATIPPAQFSSLRAKRSCELQAAPGLGLYYLAFDVTEPPLDDVRLREALSLAIDRERLVAMLGRGEVPAHGLVPPSVRSHVPAIQPGAGLGREARERRAREALAATGRAPPAIELTYDAGDVHRQVAVAVRAMWQDVLGIDATLRQLEWKAFLDQRGDRAAWQVMRFVWVGDYDDASSFTDLFVGGRGNNLPGYSNPRYDGLVREAARESDPPLRQELLTRAEEMLLGDHVLAPLYFMTSKHLVAPHVSGFLPNPLDRHPSRWLRLDGLSPRSGSSAAARCGSGDGAS